MRRLLAVCDGIYPGEVIASWDVVPQAIHYRPGVVKLLATDLALFEITENGFVLKETAPGWPPEDIQEQTEAELIIADDLRKIQVQPA